MMNYFVVYRYRTQDGYSGIGTCEIVRDCKVRSSKDIVEIRDKIKENRGYAEVAVLHWQRFED